jgi:hypothetical protein
MYALVLNRWRQFFPFLNGMMKTIKTTSSEAGGSFIAEIRFQIAQTLEAQYAFDSTGFFQCYHRLLEVVMQSSVKLELPDTLTFTKQVGQFHTLLMKKFQMAATGIEALLITSDA